MHAQCIHTLHQDCKASGLAATGCDIEEVVRSRAVRRHIENRILVYKIKTAIFE